MPLLAWLAVLVGLTALPRATTRLMTWPYVGIAWLWWVAPLLVALWCLYRRRDADPLLTATGLATLLAASISAIWAPLPALSAPHFWPLAGFGGLLLLAAHRTSLASAAAQLLPLLSAAFTWISLGGWIGTHAGSGSLWSIRNDYPFGHSNTTAGALLLGLPWLTLATIKARHPIARVAFGITILAALVALAATSSRAAVGVLGVGIAAATLVGVWRAPWSFPRKALLVAVAGTVILAGVLSNERLRDLVLHQQWSGIAAASNSQRGAMLEAGWQLWERRPLLGYGPGSVPFAYPLVRAQLGSALDDVLQLHSTPIHLAATLGLAGSIAAALGMVWFSRRSLQRLRQLSLPPLTAITSLAGYGLFALTDYQLDQPWIAAVLALNVSLLAWPQPSAANRRAPLRPAILFFIGLACGLILPNTLRDLRARAAYHDALGATSDAAALNGFARAAEFNPRDPYYRHQEASLAFQLSLRTADPAIRTGLRNRARRALEATLDAGPTPEYATLNLAWLDLEDGDPANAQAMFGVARQFAPTRQDLLIGTALTHHALGQPEAATTTLALAFLQDPTDIGLPLWQNSTLRVLRDQARHWLQQRATTLTSRQPDAPQRLAEIETWATAFDTQAAGLPLPASHLRRRAGYPILAYHPDGPPPVDFQIITPAYPSIVPPREVQPGINLGLPAPVLMDLLENPPPPDADS